MAVECKALSIKFPLVIQRVPRTKIESFHEIYYAFKPNQDSHIPHIAMGNSEILRTKSRSLLYPEDQFVGKSSHQIGKQSGKLSGNDKEIYEKWAQAISSSHDLITECTYEREKLGLPKILTAIFPVMVVSDNCLWCVDYNSEGTRIKDPEKVDFFIGKEFWEKAQLCGVYTVSHLKILTYSGFKLLIQNIASNFKYWDEVFPQNNLEVKRF